MSSELIYSSSSHSETRNLSSITNAYLVASVASVLSFSPILPSNSIRSRSNTVEYTESGRSTDNFPFTQYLTFPNPAYESGEISIVIDEDDIYSDDIIIDVPPINEYVFYFDNVKYIPGEITIDIDEEDFIYES